ncbi:MAG TPA: hypothetical protein VJ521_13910 [Acidobacteriota bacterium]|nr:hypothetical protein [Acidobacteriota bacterium]
MMSLPTPVEAYWNQRFLLSENRDLILTLCKAVGRPSDLWPYQWAQLIAYAVTFQPDLILELGRGQGNSTCAFTQATNWMSQPCKVVSVCRSRAWQETTAAKIESIVPAEWFHPLQIHETDILTFDFGKILSGAKRVFIFWDAHGYEIAERMLGEILPAIADLDHVVAMHDLSDSRYLPASANEYGDLGMWKGNTSGQPRLRIGYIDSAVEQSVAITDFTSRNNMDLHSADHSFHQELNAEKQKELRERLGDELFSLNAHWFWFSLNEASGPFTFPKFHPPVSKEPPAVGFLTRIKVALKILLKRYPADRFL